MMKSNKIRRVVITGIGVVSSIGCSTRVAWQNLLAGQCGITKLSGIEYEKLPCRIAAQIPKAMLNLEDHFNKRDLKTMSPASAYALIAAKEALEQAQYMPMEQAQKDNTGVAIGIGMVDLNDTCQTHDLLKKGYNLISPYFVPRILTNMAAGQVSIKYGFRGPNHSVSTACATGVHSIGDAYRFIKTSQADVMVCGGAEACISPLAVAGFGRLRALSTNFNESPQESSRPFDNDRDGFVMGEGAAILIIEELEHATLRKADIIAEILGYGLSGDASHLTAPSKDGMGAQLAMNRAIQDANLAPEDITYINAHATSTPIGDQIEIKAIHGVFGEYCRQLFVSSTKGAHGHLLGSAGNLESAFTALACSSGILPPTINLNNLADDMNIVNHVSKSLEWQSSNKRRVALKNSFGFGGTNACLCIGEFLL